MPIATYKRIQARNLKVGMWVHDSSGGMLVDDVQDTRFGDIMVRMGHSRGDDSATRFYEQDEILLIAEK